MCYFVRRTFMICLGLIIISFDYKIYLDMKLENVTCTAPFDQYKSLTEFNNTFKHRLKY